MRRRGERGLGSGSGVQPAGDSTRLTVAVRRSAAASATTDKRAMGKKDKNKAAAAAQAKANTTTTTATAAASPPGGKSTASGGASKSISPVVAGPSAASSSSPLAAYLSVGSLVALGVTAVCLFALLFLGEWALGALLKRLFEFVFNEDVRSLDHAISQLEEPLLLHSAILLFQLFLCSLLAFAAAWVCSNCLLSIVLSQRDAAGSDAILNSGALVPTTLMLSSMGLVRLACFALKLQPTQHLLLLQWSFPFSSRVFDSAYYGLIAVSVFAAVSVTTAMRRIELLEARSDVELQAKRQAYMKQRAAWEAQQARNAATVRQAQQIVAAASRTTSPAKQDQGETVAAGAIAHDAPTSPRGKPAKKATASQ